MKKAILLLALFTLLFFKATTTALCPESYIDFFVGGHADSVKFQVPENNSLGNPATTYYDLKNLRGSKVGLKGQVALSHRWFLKGFFDYGWVNTGNFSYTDNTSETATVLGNTSGNVANMDVAVGYNFYPTTCLQLAPTFGWGYDKIQVFTDQTTLDGVSSAQRNIKTYWGGPFLGVDAMYLIACNWRAYAGYEFHYTTNQLKMRASDLTTTRGHIRNLIGNLVRLGIKYKPECLLWHFGLEAIGSTYTSCQRNGWISPGLVEGSYSKAKLNHVRINSVNLLLSSGFNF